MFEARAGSPADPARILLKSLGLGKFLHPNRNFVETTDGEYHNLLLFSQRDLTPSGSAAGTAERVPIGLPAIIRHPPLSFLSCLTGVGAQLRFQWQEAAIDLLHPRDQHDQQIFQRRRKKRMDGCYYWVVSAEDFILQKLKVGRPRDFEDAVSVVERRRKELDHTYLEHWARQLGVTEELSYIMAS